jgi:hypothetical protein
MNRTFRGLIFLVVAALLLSCDSYNLSLKNFYEGRRGSGAPSAFTSVTDIVPYLVSTTGGVTVAEPVPLPVDIALDNTGWEDLLDAIGTSGKFVTLDLSACPRGTLMGGTGLFSDGGFDPGEANSTGKDRIVSLVLPNAAIHLLSGAYQPSFEYFTALESVTGNNITTINQTVFRDCAALRTVSFPNVSDIGADNFSNTGAATLTVTLGNTAPTLGTDMFNNVTAPKTVTVKVPFGATGYGTVPGTYTGADTTPNWGNGFRGGGWNGSALTSSSTVNSNITLTIEEL